MTKISEPKGQILTYNINILKKKGVLMMVKVYTSPSCTWCVKLKEYLTKKGVEYEVVDVSADRAIVKELVAKTGQMGVPVTEIDGEYIIGFDKEKLNAKLGIE